MASGRIHPKRVGGMASGNGCYTQLLYSFYKAIQELELTYSLDKAYTVLILSIDRV